MSNSEPQLANIKADEKATPTAPSNFAEASLLSQTGLFIDVSGLIDQDKTGNIQAKNIQSGFDRVSRTVSSPKFTEYRASIETALEVVTGQEFIIDLEDTCIISQECVQTDGDRKKIYFALPHMTEIIIRLTKNGNKVTFLTTAEETTYNDVRQALHPDLAQLPVITVEESKKAIEAYRDFRRGTLNDEQLLHIVQQIYPGATQEVINQGKEIISEKTIELFEDENSTFLRRYKHPQLFISPNNGFFIDNNRIYAEDAVENGWPKKRAIVAQDCWREFNAYQVAQDIAQALKVA